MDAGGRRCTQHGGSTRSSIALASLQMHDPLPHIDLSTSSGADKEARGRVVVVGGSAETAGAVLLAGEAALRVGAGKVALVVPEEVAVPLAVRFPEARVVSPANARDLVRAAAILVFGPGLVDEDAARELLPVLTDLNDTPVLVDAGGLPLVDQIEAPLVVTPNADEAEQCAGLSDAVVVDKGATTTVSDGNRRWRHDEDIPGLAMSGSGDVLAGAIAGLLARSGEGSTVRFEAACWGVAAHAEAARTCTETIAAMGFLARELVAQLPRAIAHLVDEQGSGHG